MNEPKKPSQVPVLVVLAGFLVTFTALETTAQGPTERKGFSGRQLFHHDWKWTGPATKLDAVRAAQTRRRGAFLPSGMRGDGLGPLHNATSCAACHRNGGGADVTRNVTLITVDPRCDAVEKSTPQELLSLFPGVLGPGGILNFDALVHDRSTRSGYQRFRNGLAESVPGGIDDAWFVPGRRTVAAIAQRPVVAGRRAGVDYYLSQRNPQALYGLGDIESINADRVRALARHQTIKTDGEITGRFVGKYGWRGQVPSVEAFVRGACAAELGLTQRSATNVNGVELLNAAAMASQADDPADPTYVNLGTDMTFKEVMQLTQFVSRIPRPIERRNPGHSVGDLLDGEQIFNSIGCVDCHVADIHPISGLFSDLLLHDMGRELQAPSPAPIGDLRRVAKMTAPRFPRAVRSISFSGASYYSPPDQLIPLPYPFDAPERPRFPRGELPTAEPAKILQMNWDTLQREWRTPPLWGVADTAPYLHDGRAETLDEAILWHGGEAKSSRRSYQQLSPDKQALLLAFLSSLRAPPHSLNP